MNAKNVGLVLHIDGVVNALAGLMPLWFNRSIVTALGWPVIPGSAIYPRTLGAVLLGFAFAVFMAGKNPSGTRETILGSIIAKLLAGVVILWAQYVPQPPQLDPSVLLTVVVVVEVIFAALEAVYWLGSRQKG
jgi:hypothetical protein